jgi:hypothetical protein
MKKLLLLAGALGVLAWTGESLHAGTTVTVPVTVLATQAYGVIGDARASADSTQYIGCEVYGDASGAADAECYARDSAGTTLYCTTSSPAILQAAASIGVDSYIQFGVTGTACSFLRVTKASLYRPKTP